MLEVGCGEGYCTDLLARTAQRVLVITPGTPSATRVLVTRSGDGAGGGTAGPALAVTSADLLSPVR